MGGMEFYRLITLSDRSYPAPDNLASLHTAHCTLHRLALPTRPKHLGKLDSSLKSGFLFRMRHIFFGILFCVFQRIQNILQGHSYRCHSREYCGTNLVESFQNILYCMQALGPWRWNCSASHFPRRAQPNPGAGAGWNHTGGKPSRSSSGDQGSCSGACSSSSRACSSSS